MKIIQKYLIISILLISIGFNNHTYSKEIDSSKYKIEKADAFAERVFRNATLSSSQGRAQQDIHTLNALPIEAVGRVGVNDSRYDKDITSLSQLSDLDEARNEYEATSKNELLFALLILSMLIIIAITICLIYFTRKLRRRDMVDDKKSSIIS